MILELKSAKILLPEHKAQISNYLKATRKKLGLLINFGNYPKIASEPRMAMRDNEVASWQGQDVRSPI